MPAAVIVLSVLTLGVYGLIWYGKVNREMGDFDPRMHVYSGRSMWALAAPWLVGVASSAVGTVALVAAYVTHWSLPATLPIPIAVALACGALITPYLILLIPFSVVAAVMTLERLRSLEEHVGLTTDVQIRPTRAVLRLLIPVVGGVALMLGAQRRLNAIWDRMAPDLPHQRRRG